MNFVIENHGCNENLPPFAFPQAFNEAVTAIRKNELVAFPTETVYGLGANALDGATVLKIFEAKGRPSDNPLIVHVANKSQIAPLVSKITPLAQKLIDAFMPGPITLVFEKSNIVPIEVTAGLNTVAIRIPSHIIAHIFLEMANIPVAAPSANVSGRPSTTRAKHVYDDLKGKIPFIIDGGNCDFGVESTVVDVTGTVPVILRPGSITADQIKSLCGDVQGIGTSIDISENLSYEMALNQNTPGTPMSPGMKYRHYAPKAKVIIVDGENMQKKVAIFEKLIAENFGKFNAIGIYSNQLVIETIKETYSHLKILSDEELKLDLIDKLSPSYSGCAMNVKFNVSKNNSQVKLNKDEKSSQMKLSQNKKKSKTDETNLLLAISYGKNQSAKAVSSGLFDAFRRMDEAGVNLILAEAIPVKGIGVAYMNRLLKAAGIGSSY